jgi:hypothetical protein
MILFIEAVLVGWFFIIYPLQRLRRRGMATAGSWRILVYFAALGLAFILIEIVLSQQFILFLGHPTYALSVILFSVLIFSGIGSFLSGKFQHRLQGRIALVVLGIAILGILYTIGLKPLFAKFLDWALPARIALSVVFLAPIGLLMGMPFPLGIRLVNQISPTSIPWAWGINGYTSVLGSVLTVMIGMAYGFNTVLILAVSVYVVGMLAILGFGRAPAKTTATPSMAAAGASRTNAP